MAVDPRPPGDNARKVKYRPRTWVIKQRDNVVSSGTSEQATFVSLRPTYGKGSVITLPNGTTFRRSTSYTHESVSLGEFSPYEASGEEFVGSLVGYRKLSALDFGREIGFVVNNYPKVIGGVPTDARNEAVTKALNKIADQKVNLGENLATLNQTVSLFADAAKALVKQLHYARRKKEWADYLYLNARDIARRGIDDVAASNYLKYIYGLKPLVGDVWTLAQLMKSQGNNSLLLKAVGSAARSPTTSSKWEVELSSSNIQRLSVDTNLRVKCTLWAQIDPNYTGLRALNQLGLLNPLGLTWDLIPYSFVVDWFLPVGPVMYAFTAPAGLRFVDGSIAMRGNEVGYFNYRPSTGTFSESKLVKNKFVRPMIVPVTREFYSRSSLTNWPLPGFWFDSDPFRADRPLKALALSIMALSGSRPPVR